MANRNVPHPHVRALREIASRVGRSLGEDHKAGSLMRAEANRLAEQAEALDNVRRNRRPVETPEAHALKVGKLAQQFDNQATDAFNRAMSHWRAGVLDAQGRIAAKVDLRPDAFAQEIRDAFRKMKRPERLAQLKEFIEENNGPALAAIVKAPGFLSGVSDKERVSYERAMIVKHAGAEAEELAALDEAYEAAYTAMRTAEGIAKQFADPRQLAEIERTDAIAKAAVEAFTQTTQ